MPLFVTFQPTVIVRRVGDDRAGRGHVGGDEVGVRGQRRRQRRGRSRCSSRPCPPALYSKTLLAWSVVTVTVRVPTLAEPSGMVTVSDRLRLRTGADVAVDRRVVAERLVDQHRAVGRVDDPDALGEGAS